MVKKKTARRRSHRAGRTRNSRWRRKLVFYSLLSALVAGFIYVLWLDYQVNTRFSGRRWQIPARVYASPTEIYTGQKINAARIGKILDGAGYEAVSGLPGPGEYRPGDPTLHIHLREFAYPDSRQAAQQITVELENGSISAIYNHTHSRDETIIRLEPELIGKIYPESWEDRIVLRPEDIPQQLVAGLLAVEDRHFYAHPGIDLKGIARAALSNLRAGEITQGGSTLTQQLVKNYFLTRERTLQRKLNEMIMAVLLEQRYSKQEILTAYCNEIFLGQQGKRSIHGFGTAAEFYFHRPLNELNTGQIALLVALVRGASFYDPRRHTQRASKRRNRVLQQMQAEGHITADEARIALATPLGVKQKPGWSHARYPAFLQLVRQQLLQAYRLEDLRSAGLSIFTTLDVRLQETARRATVSTLASLETGAAAQLQAAAVYVNHNSGAVLALLGSRDPDVVSFNRAMSAYRQIGSLIKPFIYYTALQTLPGVQVTSRISDSTVRIRQADGSVWEPENYDRTDHGDVTLLEALARSYNRATVRLGLQTGTGQVLATLRRLGIARPINAYDSLLLGAVDLTPLEVAQLYQALANGGFVIPLNSIDAVLDEQARPLQRAEIELQHSLSPEQVYLVNFMLLQAVRLGTARGLGNYPALPAGLAGKTGTSNDLRDSWFAGFGDDITGVVWLGRDDNSSSGLTGAGGALHVWAATLSAYAVNGSEPIAPPHIQWAGDIVLEFDNHCIRFARIPYSGAQKPQSDHTCN